MPSIEAEFEVYCAKCGAGLCNNSTVRTRMGNSPAVEMEPCDRCLETSYENGYQKGAEETAEEYEVKLAELQKRIEYLESLEREVA